MDSHRGTSKGGVYTAAPSSTSDRSWVGGSNPTEHLTIDMEKRYREIQLEVERSEDETLRLSRSALNFCRATGHERILMKSLPLIGRRRCRFAGCASDSRVNQESHELGGGDVNLMLTLITAEGIAQANLLPVANPKAFNAWKSLLMGLEHPHVLRTYDCGMTLDGHLGLLRPLVAQGSIRDLLYAQGERAWQHDPLESYHTKYESVNPITGEIFTRPGRGLRLDLVARFGYQVLLGLKYLETQNVPYFHLHTGNVLLRGGGVEGSAMASAAAGVSGGGPGDAVLSDYENASLGFKHRFYRKLRKFGSVDPQHAAFACLMYEMSTGSEVGSATQATATSRAPSRAPSRRPSPSSSRRSSLVGGMLGNGALGRESPNAETGNVRSPATTDASPNPDAPSSSPIASSGFDLHIRDPQFGEVNDLIQKILTSSHQISYDELLAHPFFRQVKLAPIPHEAGRPLDKRTAGVLAPILAYHSMTLYPGHPSLSSITLPMKIAQGTASPISTRREFSTSAVADSSVPEQSPGMFGAGASPSSRRRSNSGEGLDASLLSSSVPQVIHTDGQSKKAKKKAKKAAKDRANSRDSSDLDSSRDE
jgi:hypothetical protein